MEIKQQYVEHYLHDIALDQLVADYQEKGYHVSKKDTIGNYHPDLVARKGDEVIVIEIKSGKLTPEKRRQVVEIGDYVRTHKNHRFLVVLATPPKPKQIDIPNLDQLLYEYLGSHPPVSLYALPQYAHITAITDSTVNTIVINDEGSIVANGNGTAEITVGYSQSDADGVLASDVIPFVFEVTLKYNEANELYLTDAKTLDFDISSFQD